MTPEYSEFSADWAPRRTLSTDDLDFGGAEHRLRGWLLFVLEAVGRVGLAPVVQERLHLLLYFAAVLSPIYRLETPVMKILKHRSLPFYPEAQFALERLAVDGHVENEGRAGIGDDGWGSDNYRISEIGLETAELLRLTAWGRRVRDFARDLVQGFARLDPEKVDCLATEDSFYREDRMRLHEVKTVTALNEAIQAADWVADDEEAGPANERDRVFLYLAYLEARMAEAA